MVGPAWTRMDYSVVFGKIRKPLYLYWVYVIRYKFLMRRIMLVITCQLRNVAHKKSPLSS
jgi:hypothetical protein